MAHLLLNKNNNIICLAKDLNQLRCQHISYEGEGKIINVSDADFNLIQLGTKFVSTDGTSLILTDNNFITPKNNKEEMDNEITNYISRIDSRYNRHKNNSFGVELQNFKTLLQNVDTSTINYPYEGTILKYLKDAGHPVLSPLQIY
jgi:hypothetical protein